MLVSEPVPIGMQNARRPTSATPPTAGTTAIAVYSCGEDEVALLRALAPTLGVVATVSVAPALERNVDLARGKRCVSVGHQHQITNATLTALSSVGVRYVSTRSAGCDHIDVSYANRVGISVGTVEYSPASVADYTLMLMLMAVRHAKSVVLRADAHDYRLSGSPGRELRDLTVGVVGTGRIGAAVIERLRGFGCRVLAHDRCPKVTVDYISLDELLRSCDVVTLHTPLTADTRHLLDAHRLAQAKPGAVVINTGRGGLIDTDALLSALWSGRLGGAALDVLEGEEGTFYADRSGRSVDPRLLELQALPNVLISPHTAYYTDRSLRDMIERSLRNCLDFEGSSRHV